MQLKGIHFNGIVIDEATISESEFSALIERVFNNVVFNQEETSNEIEETKDLSKTESLSKSLSKTKDLSKSLSKTEKVKLNKPQIIVIDEKGNELILDTMKEAAAAIGCSIASVSQCLSGKIKKVKGYSLSKTESLSETKSLSETESLSKIADIQIEDEDEIDKINDYEIIENELTDYLTQCKDHHLFHIFSNWSEWEKSSFKYDIIDKLNNPDNFVRWWAERSEEFSDAVYEKELELVIA